LAEATRGIDQVKDEAGTRIESVKMEANARVEAVEAEAKKRVEVIRRENEEKVLRLEADLRGEGAENRQHDCEGTPAPSKTLAFLKLVEFEQGHVTVKAEPIIVVGGGLGGAAVTLVLALKGFPVCLLDETPEFSLISYGFYGVLTLVEANF
jgi:hypothetical protein